VAVALLGEECSPQPHRQEANFRLRPAANCHHQNEKIMIKHMTKAGYRKAYVTLWEYFRKTSFILKKRNYFLSLNELLWTQVGKPGFTFLRILVPVKVKRIAPWRTNRSL